MGGLVGFGLGCAIINAASGQSLAAASHSIDMAQYTAPRTPAFLPYQVAAETRLSLRGSYGELPVAPSLTFVKSDIKNLDPSKNSAISTKNYNNVKPSLTSKWGIGSSSNGRRPDAIYAGAAIPEVGARPEPGELIMGRGLKPDEIKAQGYGATKDYAMFGNSEYEKLSNNLKPKVTENVDQSPKARR